MNTRPLIACGALLVLAFASDPSDAQAAPGNLIKTTTTFLSNSAMPAGMAPETSSETECVSADQADFFRHVTEQPGCAVSDIQHNGNQLSYHSVCDHDTDHSVVDASFTLDSDGGYHGKMRATNSEPGMPQPITTEMTMVGTRIGSCDYKGQTKP